MKSRAPHEPVMACEVIRLLRLKIGYKVLDATVGCGGHAGYILDKIKPDGFLVGIDRDPGSLKIAEDALARFGKICRLIRANFKDADRVLADTGVGKVNAALFDLGVSSYQIEETGRGFSFGRDEPLDMRMDPAGAVSAADIVNKYKREDLERIIRELGEERYFRRIAGFILERRATSPISSTRELSELIRKAVGMKYRTQKIHPATRTFQALRIAVNGELDNIDEALAKAPDFLAPGARVCVISFHSLEDRIAKRKFKEFEKDGRGRVITKKPLTAASDEVRENPRSRSAKLRVFEKNG